MAYKPVNDVITYIYGEMLKNVVSPQASRIRDLLDVPFWEVLVSTAWAGADVARAYKLWYDQVKTDGPWDHKKYIKTHFDLWTIDDAQSRLYMFDIWSNIHYGYVGLACGFPEDNLLACAGYAQKEDEGTDERVSNVPIYDPLGRMAVRDDPHDQAAIKVGFELWDNYKMYLSPNHILNALRLHKDKLNVKPA